MVTLPLIGEVNTFVLIGAAALLIIVLVFLFSDRGKKTVASQTPRPFYEIGFLFLIALLGINVIGELVKGFGIDLNVRFGPALLAFTIITGLVFALRTVTGGFRFDDTKSVALFVTTLALLIAAIILIPRVLPEYFSIAGEQLQSIIGGTVQSIVAPGGP